MGRAAAIQAVQMFEGLERRNQDSAIDSLVENIEDVGGPVKRPRRSPCRKRNNSKRNRNERLTEKNVTCAIRTHAGKAQPLDAYYEHIAGDPVRPLRQSDHSSRRKDPNYVPQF